MSIIVRKSTEQKEVQKHRYQSLVKTLGDVLVQKDEVRVGRIMYQLSDFLVDRATMSLAKAMITTADLAQNLRPYEVFHKAFTEPRVIIDENEEDPFGYCIFQFTEHFLHYLTLGSITDDQVVTLVSCLLECSRFNTFNKLGYMPPQKTQKPEVVNITVPDDQNNDDISKHIYCGQYPKATLDELIKSKSFSVDSSSYEDGSVTTTTCSTCE